MPDEIKVDRDKFDRILKRMADAKPLSKAEISARLKADKAIRRAAAHEKFRKQREVKKLGQ